MTLTEMSTLYNAMSAAHTYALGFTVNGSLYVATLTFDELSTYFKLDHASSKRGGAAKIRIRMTSAQRKALAATAELLGSAELLTLDSKHNRGENFERELTERWTAERWVKDSVPFTEAGDITVNGTAVQVKLDGAELTNEKTLQRLAA